MFVYFLLGCVRYIAPPSEQSWLLIACFIPLTTFHSLLTMYYCDDRVQLLRPLLNAKGTDCPFIVDTEYDSTNAVIPKVLHYNLVLHRTIIENHEHERTFTQFGPAYQYVNVRAYHLI